MPYIATDNTASTKPYGPSTGVPTSARKWFKDTLGWRPFKDIAEIIAYFNTSLKRTHHDPILLNVGGTFNTGQVGFAAFTGGTYVEMWWKDGTADNQLVLKGRGTTQRHVSGTTVNIGETVDWLIVDPPAPLATLTANLKPNPADREVIEISSGGTIPGAGTVVITQLTIAGGTIIGYTVFNNFKGEDVIAFRYSKTNNSWYQIK